MTVDDDKTDAMAVVDRKKRALELNREFQESVKRQLRSVEDALEAVERERRGLAVPTRLRSDAETPLVVEGRTDSSTMIDWNARYQKQVSAKLQKRSALSNPSRAWTKTEEQKLLVSVEAHEGHHWDSVSQVVGRPAIQCLQHYQRVLNRAMLRSNWTAEEDELLLEAVAKCGTADWQAIASRIRGRTRTQCRERYVKSLAPSVKGKWRPDEERRLRLAVAAYGTDWRRLAAHLPTRTDAQVREKWVNCLDPELEKRDWTSREDEQLRQAVDTLGVGNWSAVAARLESKRTDAQCYRRWIHLSEPKLAFAARAARAVRHAALPRLNSRTGDDSCLRPQLEAADFEIALK